VIERLIPEWKRLVGVTDDVSSKGVKSLRPVHPDVTARVLQDVSFERAFTASYVKHVSGNRGQTFTQHPVANSVNEPVVRGKILRVHQCALPPDIFTIPS
jgi:hypothetical protein